VYKRAICVRVYMEANLAGAPPLPDGVHAIIGNFDQLAGTATGAALREWCANMSWPLFWARTPPGSARGHHSHGGGGQPGSFADDSTRLADPMVLRHTRANLTASAAMVAPTAQGASVINLHCPRLSFPRELRGSLAAISCLWCPKDRLARGYLSRSRSSTWSGARRPLRSRRRPTARPPTAPR
jgi:hypothetical protein